MALHLVRFDRGPAYDPTRSRRAQDGWDEHARFMDALARRGTVLLGGPIGADVDIGRAVLIVSADDEQAVRAVLALDPWHDTVLTIESVEHWWVWLRSPEVADALAPPDPTG